MCGQFSPDTGFTHASVSVHTGQPEAEIRKAKSKKQKTKSRKQKAKSEKVKGQWEGKKRSKSSEKEMFVWIMLCMYVCMYRNAEVLFRLLLLPGSCVFCSSLASKASPRHRSQTLTALQYCTHCERRSSLLLGR